MTAFRSTSAPFRRTAQRWIQPHFALWALPLVVAALIAHESQRRLEYVIAACLAIPILAWTTRRPERALAALAAFLPLETVGFGLLLGLHVPSSLLRDASAFKETMGLALLTAGVNELRLHRRSLEAVDYWALSYVAVVTVYLIVPHLFSPTEVSFSVRLLAWRVDCGYVLLFFGVRHAAISASGRQRFWRTVLGVGVLTIVTGLYQELAHGSWTRFLLYHANLTQYFADVLRDTPAVVASTLAYVTTIEPLRISSIFISPFDMADFLLVVAAFLLARIASGQRNRWQYLIFGGLVATLFFSRVRADAVALGVMLVVALLPSPRRPTEARVRLIGAVILGLILVLPVVGGTRFVGAQGGSSSDQGHIREIRGGIDTLLSHPFGLGLGENPETANRALLAGSSINSLTTDNAVTQVGDELGFEGLVPWAGFLIVLAVAIRRRARDGDPITAAGGLALLGILTAGQYHLVFLNYDVSWLLWAAAALALPSTASGADQPTALATMTP